MEELIRKYAVLFDNHPCKSEVILREFANELVKDNCSKFNKYLDTVIKTAEEEVEEVKAVDSEDHSNIAVHMVYRIAYKNCKEKFEEIFQPLEYCGKQKGIPPQQSAGSL